MDNWHWYQWTLAILMFLRVFVHAAKHGEKNETRYSFPASLVDAFLFVFLLWKGGFWS